MTRNSNYVLIDGAPEIRRLSAQYVRLKKTIGRPEPVPASIDLNQITNVLDVAAGTAVWTLDLASMPDIKARLPSKTALASDLTLKPVNLYACDITTEKFPAKEITDPLGITLFQQDVTESFPEDMKGKFDLVHMSLVVYALTADGWKKALQNLYDLLKPGGHLLSMEGDPVYYSAANLPLLGGEEHNLEACMDGSSWVHKANHIFTGGALRNNFIVGLSHRLPLLLDSASFSVVSYARGVQPLGRLCATFKGPNGASFEDDEESTIESSMIVLGRITQVDLENDRLEAPKGEKITSEDGRQQLLEELRKGFEEEGVSVLHTEYLARKR